MKPPKKKKHHPKNHPKNPLTLNFCPPSQRLLSNLRRVWSWPPLAEGSVEVRPSWRFTYGFYPGGGPKKWRFCSKQANRYIIWIHQNMIRIWDIQGRVTVTSWKKIHLLTSQAVELLICSLSTFHPEVHLNPHVGCNHHHPQAMIFNDFQHGMPPRPCPKNWGN